MKRLTKILAGLSVLAVLMVCMTAVSFAAAKVNVTVGSSNIINPNSFDYITGNLSVAGDTAEKYGFDDKKESSVVTFADVMCTMCAEKFGGAFTKDTAANYLAYGETGYYSKWFGVDTYNVGYAFNRDFSMSGSAFDEIKDGTTIDILEMSNYASPLTYFDKTSVETVVGAEVKLQLSGSSYGMTKEILRSAEGKAVQAAVVNADGSLTDIEGATMDDTGNITVSFGKVGTYYVSAYGEVTSKDYNGIDTVAPIGLPLAKVVVKKSSEPVKTITVNFKSSSILKENQFDYYNTSLKVSGDAADLYGFDDTKDQSVVTFADVMSAVCVAKYKDKYTPLTASNYLAYGDTGYYSRWFGVDTYNVGYAFNRDFGMSGSAFDELNDGTIIDVVEMSNYASPLTYFNKDKVTTTVGKNVTLALKGSSYGMKGEVIKPAQGKKIQLATVNKDGTLTDINNVVVNSQGQVTLKFAKKGTFIISAYGEGISKDYNQEVTTARIGLPLATVTVNAAPPAVPAKPVIKSAKRTTKKKATVVWKKAKNAKKYKVAYKKAGAKKWTYKTTTKTKIVLKKLNAKKKYKVKVMAINGSAKSKYSKVKTIKIKK